MQSEEGGVFVRGVASFGMGVLARVLGVGEGVGGNGEMGRRRGTYACARRRTPSAVRDLARKGIGDGCDGE